MTILSGGCLTKLENYGNSKGWGGVWQVHVLLEWKFQGGWDGQKQKCPLWGYGYFLELQIVWFSLFTGLFKRAKIQILHLVRKLSHNAQQSDYVLGGKPAMKMTDVQVLFGMDPSLGYICCMQYSSCSKNYVSYVCKPIKKGKVSLLHCDYLHQKCLI